MVCHLTKLKRLQDDCKNLTNKILAKEEWIIRGEDLESRKKDKTLTEGHLRSSQGGKEMHLSETITKGQATVSTIGKPTDRLPPRPKLQM